MYLPKESRFRTVLIESFRRMSPTGWYTALVNARGQRAGLPDLLFVENGKIVWVEAKVHRNSLTPIQVHQIAKMREAGLRVAVAVLHTKGDKKELQIFFKPHSLPDLNYDYRISALDRKFWDQMFGITTPLESELNYVGT